MTTEMKKLKIAFSSSDGVTVDGHFGSCEQFYIYTVDAEKQQKLEVRQATSGRGVEKNAIRAELISDCHLLFCASIGGPAAARVIRSGIYPMKCKPVGETYPDITEQLSLLQERMQSESLPPWLAKLTGQSERLSNRFEALA
ncbi:NifB/NifX family molybdenum-iron cluster-binding protein [Psychromonas sp.]|nr:NifB/NifX family molybdenum-iron cluster-binding protein [Psychromonas sp.]